MLKSIIQTIYTHSYKKYICIYTDNIPHSVISILNHTLPMNLVPNYNSLYSPYWTDEHQIHTGRKGRPCTWVSHTWSECTRIPSTPHTSDCKAGTRNHQGDLTKSRKKEVHNQEWIRIMKMNNNNNKGESYTCSKTLARATYIYLENKNTMRQLI